MSKTKKMMTLDELHWRMTEVLESLDTNEYDAKRVKLQIQAGAVVLNIHRQKHVDRQGGNFITAVAGHLAEQRKLPEA